ncbi:CHAD domain-containing protein [Flavihumibacter sp. ZG627]|uniref:CHAD domain-containing protein n=1 Tax=Flavihumibacter sp. ZG627 TaxID=1463156 RepID=UPI00057EF650|nr:CHAD domain-containing protein [Flavihumibacter sp. ZG627]KIC90636.1 hypothetical protein HY58_11890 [Flavihumibacter sp. ZG627]
MGSLNPSAAAASSAINELDELRISILLDPTEEAIHAFRVGFKKLRALYRMEGMVQHQQQFKMHRNLKILYSAAGAVRDAQLLLAFIKPELGNTKLPSLLEEQLETHQDALLIRLQETGAVRADDAPIASKLANWKQSSHNKYEAFFNNKLREYIHLSEHTLYDDALHELRKLLKDILYNHQWLLKTKRAVGKIAALPIKEIDELQKLLGDYQDMVVRASVIRQLALMPALREDAEVLEAWLTGAFRKQQKMRMDLELPIRSLQHLFHLHTS